MVCVAAFIILCLLSVVFGFLSIFRRDIGQKYWQVFKKAWGCVSKKVRLQKCETNFKDDVKNTILRKIVLKKPHLVQPLSIAIEIVSVFIVIITIWSLVISIKAALALWVFGTCNVSQPSQCTLGAEVCSIDAEEPKNLPELIGRNFAEWGEIFSSIPDRLRNWDASQYLSDPTVYYSDSNQPLALDIFDPGCSACLQSYKNQLSSGFFNQYRTALMLYPIKLPDGSYKFKNSGLIARYYYAAKLVTQQNQLSIKILHRLYTEFDQDYVNFQTVFSTKLSESQAEQLLQAWLKEFGVDQEKLQKIITTAHSQSVTNFLESLDQIVLQKIHVKGIPTLIYNNRKHHGLYRAP